MPDNVFAHSLPGHRTDDWEPLRKHLECVGSEAAERAERFGWAEMARLAGRLHDIGKTSAQFQAYIRGQAPRGGDHSTAGALEAARAYRGIIARLLALLIAGHHSGLADPEEIERRLKSEEIPDYTGWQDHTDPLPDNKTLKPTRTTQAPLYPWLDKSFSWSFLVRMLFSCLVDADFVATETFVNQKRLPRGGSSLTVLREKLRTHLEEVRANAGPTELNALRGEILDHVIGKAGQTPGFFTLTVPTGGGKTLASLAFALEHALLKGKRRVVVVIPFTAIIEQTADVYRRALDDRDAVLEHHAGFDWEAAHKVHDDGGDEQDGLGRLRRAAENWDAPIVVTTAVQFFESLYSNQTSKCRKLHNLADSVIVLDEAQTVPPRLLLPCLAALDELQRGYGASVVLCTATQPAWRKQDVALIDEKPGGERVNWGLSIDDGRELAPHPRELYARLRRVRVEVMSEPVDDTTLVAAFERAPRMLCIVNSRAHARDLFERIAGLAGARHLTTLMCPAHRRIVLGDVARRLRDEQPVRLVATSLIEAGVDISFPEVWRASTGLDSIAQAAGRCNREGELLPKMGRVVVFTPAAAKAPQALQAFQQAAAPVLRDSADPLGLDAVAAYFRELYFLKGVQALDATVIEDVPGILAAIRRAEDLRVPFRMISDAFRMIDQVAPPVLVPWDCSAQDLLEKLAAEPGSVGGLLRRLQPYAVSVPTYAVTELLKARIVAPVRREFGDAVLQLLDMDRYRSATGLDLSDGAYRRAEENIW